MNTNMNKILSFLVFLIASESVMAEEYAFLNRIFGDKQKNQCFELVEQRLKSGGFRSFDIFQRENAVKRNINGGQVAVEFELLAEGEVSLVFHSTKRGGFLTTYDYEPSFEQRSLFGIRTFSTFLNPRINNTTLNCSGESTRRCNGIARIKYSASCRFHSIESVNAYNVSVSKKD